MTSPKGQTRRPARAEASRTTPPYVSPSLEVLHELEIQNAMTNLEARIDSLEIDLARATGSREDDARRLASEMAVMKARVEDALNAFSATTEELREMMHGVEKRLADTGAISDEPNALREELQARVDGTMAGIGDVLESMAGDVRGNIGELGNRMSEIQEGMLRIAEYVGAFTPVAQRLAELEAVLTVIAGRSDS
jgi:chromosome segregation ATPase